MSGVNALFSICIAGAFMSFVVVVIAGTVAYAARMMIDGFDI